LTHPEIWRRRPTTPCHTRTEIRNNRSDPIAVARTEFVDADIATNAAGNEYQAMLATAAGVNIGW